MSSAGETIELSKQDAAIVYGMLKRVEGWSFGFSEDELWDALKVMERAMALPVRRTQEEALAADFEAMRAAGKL